MKVNKVERLLKNLGKSRKLQEILPDRDTCKNGDILDDRQFPFQMGRRGKRR